MVMLGAALAVVALVAAWLAAGMTGLLVALLVALIAEPIALMRERSRTASPATGASGVIGRTGEVVAPCSPQGRVRIDGEYWRAVAQGESLPAGVRVVVVGLDGLTVHVKRGE